MCKLQWHLRLRFPLLLLTLASFIRAQQQSAQPPPPAPAPPAETVVVTGTYEPLTVGETDRSLSLLSARGAQLVLDTLADLLRLDPSLDLQQRAPNGVQMDLSIRGGSFGQTLVLLNGLRLDDAQSGHHDMDIPVPLDAVSRIEVLQGSGSTMYGSDAVAGVINVIAEPPTDGFEIRLRTAVGSFGTNQQRVSLADTFGNLSEQLTFSRDFSTGFIPDRDYRNLQFSSTTLFKSGLGASNLTLAYMDHPFGADQFYGPYPSWEDTKTWWLGFNQDLGRDTEASFAYRRHSDLYVLFRDDPAIYTNHHSDESYQAALRRHQKIAANTTLSYGVEALHESIVSNNLGDHARSRAAAYAAIDFRALKRFSLSLSAREEFYRKYSAEFTQPLPVATGCRRNSSCAPPPAAPSACPATPISIIPTHPIWAIQICFPNAPGPSKVASTGTPPDASPPILRCFSGVSAMASTTTAPRWWLPGRR
jgi:iron complex outermembrane receptor protein